MIFPGAISMMPYLTHGKSRAINAENRTGEKGKGGMAVSPLGPSRKGSPCLKDIQPGQKEILADIEGPGVIQHIWITVDNKTSEGECFVLRDLILRMYWDEEENPSVEVPLGDFFCCGFGQECIVNSAVITVVPSRGLNSYFSMPFHKHARIVIENQHKNPIPAFFYQIDYCLYDSLPEDTAYFHAQWRRQAITELGKDYVILDNVKGSGHYIGTYLGLSALQRYWWGEGEVKFYIDGDEEYLQKSIKLYKYAKVYAQAFAIPEKEMGVRVPELVKKLRPNIVVITGHDALEDKEHEEDLNSYRSSKYFVETVNALREIEPSLDYLIVIAGACQSHFEALIGSGANFASSPKRINIHALDPAIIASTVALTPYEEEVDLREAIEKTIAKIAGIGGLQTKGTLRYGIRKV